MEKNETPLKIAVVGLGLIGGSMAKAIKQNTPHTVFGCDINETVVRKAILLNAVDDILTDELQKECDLTIIALYPGDTVSYIQSHACLFKKGSLVIDCCGTKQQVCAAAEPIAAENGFLFMGGHPMAGLEHSGFSHSKNALFHKASMVLVPSKDARIETMEWVKKFFISLGFTNIQISSAEEHDKVIAFTSQLAHVVSSAYIKSPSALEHKGFSAGSYQDLTRVASLNETMWTELFLSNPDFLAEEIDGIIARLAEYSQAIKARDAAGLKQLLKDGRERKALIDGKRF